MGGGKGANLGQLVHAGFPVPSGFVITTAAGGSPFRRNGGRLGRRRLRGAARDFLNVIGDAAPLNAVRRCWTSLWGDRAIAYHERLGLDQTTMKLAVVVQAIVAADFAGVMFTANPVTGERDEVVIDANPGLGEAVVSGLVTPDHFVLRKQVLGWKIAERQVGSRQVVIHT